MNAAVGMSLVCDVVLTALVLAIGWYLIRRRYQMCMFLAAIDFFTVVVNPASPAYLSGSQLTVLAYLGLACAAATVAMCLVGSFYRQKPRQPYE